METGDGKLKERVYIGSQIVRSFVILNKLKEREFLQYLHLSGVLEFGKLETGEGKLKEREFRPDLQLGVL